MKRLRKQFWSGAFGVAILLTGCIKAKRGVQVLAFQPGIASRPRPTQLSVGESAHLTVRARVKLNDSGISVETGEIYDFRVPPSAKWTDLIIRTDSQGYDNAYMRLFASKKRVREANWFALCVQVAEEEADAFPIGRELINVTMERSGELGFFANDHPGFYWNNFGSIPVIISRVK